MNDENIQEIKFDFEYQLILIYFSGKCTWIQK